MPARCYASSRTKLFRMSPRYSPRAARVIASLLAAALVSTADAQTLDTRFPTVDGDVYAVAVHDGVLYFGGVFDAVGGEPRANLAAVDLSTADLLDWAPGTDGTVRDLAVLSGSVYVCGDFRTLNGEDRNTLGAVDLLAGTLSTWNPRIVFPGVPGRQNGLVLSLSSDPERGRLYIGGYFISVEGTRQANVAAFDNQGQHVAAFAASSDIPVNSVAAHQGRVYIGGPFRRVNGERRTGFAAVGADDGSVLPWTYASDFPGNENWLHAGGAHVYAVGVVDIGTSGAHRGIRQLDLDGNLMTWAPGFFGEQDDFEAVAAVGDTLLLGGQFAIVGGSTNLALLHASTGDALPWMPNPDGLVRDVTLSGKYLIAGGSFGTVEGQAREGLAVFVWDRPRDGHRGGEGQSTVYPVPTIGDLTLLDAEAVRLVELVSAEGAVVLSGRHGEGATLTLNVRDVQPGVYTLVGYDASGEVIRRERVVVGE